MRSHPASFVATATGLLIVLLPIVGVAQLAPIPTALVNPAVEDPITLSPFQVGTDRDVGYAASTAMSATRTNEKLENLPNAISVLNQDFLQDIAANNFFDAVEFAVGAENIMGDTGVLGIQSGTRLGHQISFRGLQTFQQLRDGFAWYVPQDMFNTERIEVSRGPGGLAYGDVDTGGVLNISSKRAHDRDAYSAQVRYDDFGTRRFSVDLNRRIVPKRLAFRFNAIDRNDAPSARQRTNTNGTGLAGALRWDVTKGGRTAIDLTYEHGRQEKFFGNLPLADQTAAYVRGTGTNALDGDPITTGVQANGVGMQRIVQPGDVHRWVETGGTLYNLTATAAEVYRTSIVSNNAVNVAVTNPKRLPLLPAARSIVPRGQDWGGPDGKVTSNWTAGVVELQHTFTSNLRVALTHNRQRDISHYSSTNNYAAGSFLNTGANTRAVFIDVNPSLPSPTGTGTIPNPRFEEYFVGYSPTTSRDGHRVEGWRGTAVYDAKLPWGITQRVVAGVNYRQEDYIRDGFRLALTQEEAVRRGFTTASARFYSNNLVYPMHYLRDGNSDEALRLRIRPGVTTWYRAEPAFNQRFDQSLTSGSLSALGSYFKDRLRTSLGISRDHWIQSMARPGRADPVTGETRFIDAAGNFVEANRVPHYPFTSSWVTNYTYGGVFKITKWLALTGTYQESALFNSALSDNASLTDLFGNPLKPRRGQGEDYGVRFNLLEDRLHASFVYYDNTNKNVPVVFPATVTAEMQALLGPIFAGTTDTKDEAARGLEFEMVTNLTPNWTSKVALSRTLVHPTNTFPQLKGMLELARAAAKAGGLDPDEATAFTSEFVEEADANAGALGMVRVSIKRWIGSAVTRYSFTQGPLKGLAIGGSVRYSDGKPRAAAVVGGVAVLPNTFTDHQWTVNPFVSYSRKVARVRWTAQVNVDNLFDEITDQGTQYSRPRYTEPRKIISTLTARF